MRWHVTSVTDNASTAAQDRSMATTATDWTTAPVTALIDHIESTHHEYLKRQMPLITGLLAATRTANPALADELEAVWTPFVDEMESHLWKEEMILFPMVRGVTAGCGGVENPIRVMLMEHDAADQSLKAFRNLTGDYTAPNVPALNRALEEMEADLRVHMHKENDILFPRLIAR